MRRIRGPAFLFPPGYAYQRWTFGQLLPAIFMSPRFFYDDWRPLGLYPPPPGFRWVRFGPDLILVNVVTGRIADVAYGVFF